VKSTFHKVVSYALSFVVLFSAVGLTLNVHYCNTTGIVKKSIAPVVLDCDHENEAMSCDYEASNQTDSASCCAKQPTEKSAKDCCDDFIQYIRTLSDFDLPKIKIVFNSFLKTALWVLYVFSGSDHDAKTSEWQNNTGDEPPALFGKELLLAFHQLKTDPALL